MYYFLPLQMKSCSKLTSAVNVHISEFSSLKSFESNYTCKQCERDLHLHLLTSCIKLQNARARFLNNVSCTCNVQVRNFLSRAEPETFLQSLFTQNIPVTFSMDSDSQQGFTKLSAAYIHLVMSTYSKQTGY